MDLCNLDTLHNNEKVEMAIREWFQMQEPGF
jgi:hypothetical protein